MADPKNENSTSPTKDSSFPRDVPRPISSGTNGEPVKGDINDVDISSLFSSSLPDSHKCQLALLSVFFNRIQFHYGLNFVHCPTFMKSFHAGTAEADYGRPLMLAMCALAASQINSRVERTCFFEGFTRSERSANPHDESEPGQAWADAAREELMVDLRFLSAPDLMALALLCAYEMQREEYAQASMLSAVLHRGVVINAFIDEGRPGIDNHVERETERRITWASFILDTLVANCSKSHMSWDKPPEIPLPSSASEFRDGKLSKPSFIRDMCGMLNRMDQLEVHILNILAICVRHNVLRSLDVEHADDTSCDRQCCSIKAFQDTRNTVRRILESVSSQLHLEGISNGLRLAKLGVLGPHFAICFRLRLSLIDLARGSLILPETALSDHYDKIPAGFKALMLWTVKHESNQITNLVRMGQNWERSISLGDKHSPMFDDPTCIRAIVESIKVNIIHGAFHSENDMELLGALGNIRSGIRFLDGFDRFNEKMRRLILRELMLMCNLFGHDEILRSGGDALWNTGPGARYQGSNSPELEPLDSEKAGLTECLMPPTNTDVGELSAVTGLTEQEIQEAMVAEFLAGLASEESLPAEATPGRRPPAGTPATSDADGYDDVVMPGQAPEA